MCVCIQSCRAHLHSGTRLPSTPGWAEPLPQLTQEGHGLQGRERGLACGQRLGGPGLTRGSWASAQVSPSGQRQARHTDPPSAQHSHMHRHERNTPPHPPTHNTHSHTVTQTPLTPPHTHNTHRHTHTDEHRDPHILSHISQAHTRSHSHTLIITHTLT